MKPPEATKGSVHAVVTRGLLAALALCAGAASAQAPAWPAKPVRIVNAFAAGGPIDIPARAVAQRLSKVFGQQFIVENIAGAGGIIGAEHVAKSGPDGYTLMITSSSITLHPSVYNKVPFDVLKDFAPISLVSQGDIVYVVGPKFPGSNAREFVALAKASPGKLTYGSSGTGGSLHLGAELLQSMAGIQLTHVPYKGAAQALTDLMGGHLDIALVSVAPTLPLIKAGKVKLVGVASLSRSPVIPDVATFAESGVPGYEVASQNGIIAPAATPREIINLLNATLVKIINTQDLKDLFAVNGLQAVSSTPEQFASEIRREVAKWAGVVKAARIEKMDPG